MPKLDQARSWRPQSFQSGTQIVTDGSGGPWLYVVAMAVGPKDEEGDYPETIRIRHAMAGQLADFLNGGPRPAWLDDMERPEADKLAGADGTAVEATGPMYDATPPTLNWRTRQDAAARESRAALIDRLTLLPRP